MLQRAASNAYSWWWASHIRTKQSKWLEQNLQDLEEKVAYILKLIEEDGDSFAKRAEMYYKKRPELISFVEEAYRAYRALAERYDHISTELQNANTTIARVCPDQVPFMDDDDDDPAQKGQRKPVVQTANIPKVPNMPKKNLKGIITLANKKLRPTKSTQKADAARVAKSGLSKAEGLKEIDELQKQILCLQTGKEYVESSYQSWLAKYWEIEEQIKGLQQRVCCLQDEFGHGIIIEDDEARSLMVAAALKSCQDTLTHMQEQQEKSSEEAKVESKRIEDTRDKFESLKDELIGNQGNQKTPSVKDDSVKTKESKRSDKDVSGTRQHREDLQIIKEKLKEQSDVGSSGSLSVTEMAEQIDEVVSKVVNLETSFLSQTSLVQRLRTETDELQAQIRALEDDKASLIHDKKDLSSKLREVEEKLLRLHDLNRSVKNENISLQAHLNDARYNLDHLSQKLQNQKTEEELESSSEKEETSPARVKLQNTIEGRDVALNSNGDHMELQGVQLSDVHKEKHITEEDNKSLAKVQVQEGTDGAEAATVNILSADQKKSPAKVQFEKGIEGKEGAEVKNSAKEDKKSPVECAEGIEVAGSGEEEKVNTLSADEKKSPAKVQFEKGIEGKEGAEVKTSAKEDKKSPVECAEGTEVAGSGEDEKKSTAKVQFGAATKGAEGSPNLASDNLLAQKPNEKVKSSANAHDLLNVQTQTQEQAVAAERDCEPDWKHMFLKGMENREKTILTEYTTVLRNYKEAKKKLDESGMKSGDTNDDTAMQLQQLKTANTEKDEEIRSLRKKLSILQAAFGDDQSETHNGEPTVREVEVLVTPNEQSQPISEIEEKFRMNIDELLEENLDFWLRFSASFHQIQKFDTEAKDLQNDALNLVATLEEKQKKQEGSSSTRYALKSDVRPLYTHLGEIQSELALWVEKSSLLKEEMMSRCSSLSDIQEEITKALKLSAEDDDFRFTSYQAAKFQGEVLNMKQENNKVADELQAGLDHVNNLQTEVEKTLMMLSEKFGISESKIQKLEHSDSKNTVPLRSFIFGVKPKRSRTAFLFSMHPTLARKYNDIKGAVK